MSIKRLSRRDFLKVASAGAAMAFLAACQAPATPAAPVDETGPGDALPADDRFEIVHWAEGIMDPDSTNVDKHQPYIDQVFEAFREKYPNGTVRAVNMGWDEALRQNLVTALLGGTAPDVIVEIGRASCRERV